MKPYLAFWLVVSGLLICVGHAKSAEPAGSKGWISLFNGKDLDGWTVKIKSHALNDNFGSTFRVEDGVLKVAYDKYQQFDGKFGHLFHKNKYSHYIVRVEYRFVGNQVSGGPGWAIRNSGIMLHCQSPESMEKDQDFPVSIEAQMLGGDGKVNRTTANVCTPGTHIVMQSNLIKRHCTNSNSKTFHGDQWVTMEVEVHGSGTIQHRVGGETVLDYEQPQLDDTDPYGSKLIVNGEKLLREGYISLQAESHPVEFRKVEILPLKE